MRKVAEKPEDIKILCGN